VDIIADTVMDGVLVIDKPAGWTSHDVVAKVRTVLGVRKAGHTGTLDPSATGVLLICLGKATRVAEYLINSDKAYRAVLRLGVATDTQDATGAVIARREGPLPDESVIRKAMARFVGYQQQVPPMYSAVKVKGVPLYKSARAGRIVPREPRVCLVRSLEILSILPTTATDATARVPVALENATGDGPPPTIVGVGGALSAGPLSTLDVTFDVVCAKGTYIRTLCADIGEALGIGGHLAFLQRRRVGRFDIAEALSLDDLTALAAADAVSTRLHPIDSILSDLPALAVDHEAAEGIRHGVAVSTAHVVGMEGEWAQGAMVRLHDQNGRLLAVGRMLYGREELVQAQPGTAVRVEKVLA
jgi:tRNA pseudouridine55 synthase